MLVISNKNFKKGVLVLEGSFYKRGNTWSFMVDVGINPLTGKRKQKGKGGYKTKKEAQQAAAEFIVEMKKTGFTEVKEMTFEQLSDEWFLNYKKHGKVRKDGTYRIRDNERKNLMPFFKLLLANTITDQMYQEALKSLRDGGALNENGDNMKSLSYNTVCGINTTGGMIFEYGIKRGVVKIDPTIGSYVPKDKVTVEDLEDLVQIPKYLEKEELHLFLETARIHGLDRDYEVFHTIAYTGVRAGELCAMMDVTVNTEESTIKINKTLYNPKNNATQYVLNTPKTKSSIREIVVDGEVITNIKNLQNYNQMEKSLKKEAYHDRGFIFCKRGRYAGYPETIKQIDLRMARLLRIAGLNPDLTPHSLRHTHTSLLAEAGVSLEQIMERLGHQDDKITKTIYLHITKPKKKEASQKFTELMRGLKNDSDVNKPLTTE